jgi:RimJ/RimL family protein N-acetyltransferase
MISFRKISEDDLPLILSWRTDPEVTRYMSTDIEIDPEKQLHWYNKNVRDCSPLEHLMILHNDKPVGVLNLGKYNSTVNKNDWGYYIGELESKIIGGLIPAYFYNYMFVQRDISLKKITGHCFALNTKMRAIHRFYGVREVKILKEYICKHGKMFDIVLVEIMKEKWLSQKKIFKHYQLIIKE